MSEALTLPSLLETMSGQVKAEVETGFTGATPVERAQLHGLALQLMAMADLARELVEKLRQPSSREMEAKVLRGPWGRRPGIRWTPGDGGEAA